MILADIGNTHFHILKDNKILHLKEAIKLKGNIFYISVNKKREKEFLKLNKAINLKEFVKFDTTYKGLGIDRIMACKSIENGVVVDFGSAITIDIMEQGIHKGGIIMPGIYAFKKAFVTISNVLKFNIDYKESLPQNTNEALNMGSIGAIKCMIEKFRNNKKLYFTGGDGRVVANFFTNCEYIEDLVFRGMKKTINEMGLIC